MIIRQTSLPGVVVFEPKVFGDARGFFVETFRQDWLREAGVTLPFVQDNQSRSRRGVLRGLHYQMEQTQGKLVRVASGRVFDVAVDVRKGSPTFGQWEGVVLDDESHCQFYVPPGFAHGFVVLSETADFVYKCTEYYHPASEAGICWDDPVVGIKWPEEILDSILLSEKDRALPLLENQVASLLPDYAQFPDPAGD